MVGIRYKKCVVRYGAVIQDQACAVSSIDLFTKFPSVLVAVTVAIAMRSQTTFVDVETKFSDTTYCILYTRD